MSLYVCSTIDVTVCVCCVMLSRCIVAWFVCCCCVLGCFGVLLCLVWAIVVFVCCSVSDCGVMC